MFETVRNALGSANADNTNSDNGNVLPKVLADDKATASNTAPQDLARLERGKPSLPTRAAIRAMNIIPASGIVVTQQALAVLLGSPVTFYAVSQLSQNPQPAIQ